MPARFRISCCVGLVNHSTNWFPWSERKGDIIYFKKGNNGTLSSFKFQNHFLVEGKYETRNSMRAMRLLSENRFSYLW